jgi:hypothetical protein
MLLRILKKYKRTPATIAAITETMAQISESTPIRGNEIVKSNNKKTMADKRFGVICLGFKQK